MWTFEFESPVMEEEVSTPFEAVWKIFDAGHHRNDNDDNEGDDGPTSAPGGATKKVNHHLIFNWGIVNMNMKHQDRKNFVERKDKGNQKLEVIYNKKKVQEKAWGKTFG